MEVPFQMNQFETLPILEKYYPIKIVVKTFIWGFCKIARLKLFLQKVNANNICIISLHKIGDSIFTTHAIKKIAEYHKDKNISIVCFPETTAIFQLVFPEIKAVAISHNDFWLQRFANQKARKVLNELNPEIIYDLTGVITSATLIAFSSAKKLIGMNLEYFKPLYDIFSPIRNTPHLCDVYMDVVKKIMTINEEGLYEFPLRRSESKKILIHPHAGWKAKEWGIDNYIELARRLSSQYAIEFIAEKNILTDNKKYEIKKEFNLLETNSVEELIENVKNCSVLIGNDSGPIHIASLLGKSTFAIYGSTNPKYCKPHGEHHAAIRKEIHCSPVNQNYCFTDAGRRCLSIDCMKLLTVDEVYREVSNFLKKRMSS